MTGNHLVSVIVPCYNHGQYLGEALTSVLNQVYANWECIVVDNGSSDNTKEVTEAFAKKDNRIKYYLSERKGVAAARNAGIAAGSGKYILPLDADDKLGANYIAAAVNVLAKNPSVKIVYCQAELFENGKGKWKLPGFSIQGMLRENLIFCSALFRRSDFAVTKGYDESLAGFEDWDLWLSLLESGGEVRRLDQTGFYYRIRAGSRNNSLSKEQQLSIRRQIYEKHKRFYDENLSYPEVMFELYSNASQLQTMKESRMNRLMSGLLSPLRRIMSLFNR